MRLARRSSCRRRNLPLTATPFCVYLILAVFLYLFLCLFIIRLLLLCPTPPIPYYSFVLLLLLLLLLIILLRLLLVVISLVHALPYSRSGEKPRFSQAAYHMRLEIALRRMAAELSRRVREKDMDREDVAEYAEDEEKGRI